MLNWFKKSLDFNLNNQSSHFRDSNIYSLYLWLKKLTFYRTSRTRHCIVKYPIFLPHMFLFASDLSIYSDMTLSVSNKKNRFIEVEAREIHGGRSMRDEQRLLSPVVLHVSAPKWLLDPRFSDLRKSGNSIWW